MNGKLQVFDVSSPWSVVGKGHVVAAVVVEWRLPVRLKYGSMHHGMVG